jgi:hypothetical protein
VRAAACGVGDDGVEVFSKEGGEVLAREITGHVAHSPVSGESAAAQLAGRDDDFTAVGREDADGSLVELCQGNLSEATQPAKKATLARRGPGVRNVCPSCPKKNELSRIVDA